MSSNKDNIIFENTSFLQGVNHTFLKELYLKYLDNSKSVPESWVEFFDGLGEDQETIKKEILGPSWSPQKNNNLSANILKEKLIDNDQSPNTNNEVAEKEKENSVKAIALIRAYRIRGHLIANLDPLGMMERKYLEDLHPADHGFKKEDYNKKIYVGAYMNNGYATVNEILSFFRKIYCSTIGVEYMHISFPVEIIWFRK